MQNLITLRDLCRLEDNEPRILDTTLAKRLDFKRPRKVRDLVARNAEELTTYGPLPRHAPRRGALAYYLNEGQALLICALARTSQAATVRRALIDVFMAWRRGQLPASADSLAADISTLAKIVNAPVWAVHRNMLARNHVTDPTAMTAEEIKRCQRWIYFGGDYQRVPAVIWRRRWPDPTLNMEIERLATSWQKTATFVYSRIGAARWPATAQDVTRAYHWLRTWHLLPLIAA